MGYVPPRHQLPGETRAEYAAYLEELLRRQTLMHLLVIPGGLVLAIVLMALIR